MTMHATAESAGWVDPACPLDWAHPLNRRLVGEWAVVPNSGWRGGLLRDLVRGGRTPWDGTPTGPPTWPGAAGRPGGCGSLAFNGNGQYFSAPLAASGAGYKPTGAMTLTAWSKASGSNDGSPNSTIGGTLAGTLSADGSRGYWLTVAGDGSIVGDTTFFVAGGASSLTSVTASAVNDRAKWTHYAAVYVPSASITIYKNGVAVATNTTSIPASQYQGNGVPLRFGARTDNGTYLLGQADGWQVYARALGAGEVQALYQESRRGNPERFRWLGRRAWFPPPAAAPAGGNRRRRVLLTAGGR